MTEAGAVYNEYFKEFEGRDLNDPIFWERFLIFMTHLAHLKAGKGKPDAEDNYLAIDTTIAGNIIELEGPDKAFDFAMKLIGDDILPRSSTLGEMLWGMGFVILQHEKLGPHLLSLLSSPDRENSFYSALEPAINYQVTPDDRTKPLPSSEFFVMAFGLSAASWLKESVPGSRARELYEISRRRFEESDITEDLKILGRFKDTRPLLDRLVQVQSSP